MEAISNPKKILEVQKGSGRLMLKQRSKLVNARWLIFGLDLVSQNDINLVSISHNFIWFLIFLVGKSKKTKRKKKEDHDSPKKGKKSLKEGEAYQDEVYRLSPGDEGFSKGMTGMNFWILNICFCVFNCSQF